MYIKLKDNGASTMQDGIKVNFYYNADNEGVKVNGVDYKWFIDLPCEYTETVNTLIGAFHHHRETVLKLDRHMRPLKEVKA